MAKTFTLIRLSSAIVVMFLFAAGCSLWNGQRIENRLSYRQQMDEIKAIVPFGTDRDEAARALKEAGIDGEFSRVGRSIFYCHLWNRENKERWHLNIDLLFDRDGRFYATRPSGSAADVVPSDTTRATTRSDTGATSPWPSGSPNRSAFPPAKSTGYPSSGVRGEPPRVRRGDEHRRPFSNDGGR